MNGADHPRVCGENTSNFRYNDDKCGSPPRVRGKLTRRAGAWRRPRITPACAGKTELKSAVVHDISDHPRVCGENSVSAIHASPVRGSPPRVRGKLNDLEE